MAQTIYDLKKKYEEGEEGDRGLPFHAKKVWKGHPDLQKPKLKKKSKRKFTHVTSQHIDCAKWNWGQNKGSNKMIGRGVQTKITIRYYLGRRERNKKQKKSWEKIEELSGLGTSGADKHGARPGRFVTYV